jgi:plastocyanin
MRHPTRNLKALHRLILTAVVLGASLAAPAGLAAQQAAEDGVTPQPSASAPRGEPAPAAPAQDATPPAPATTVEVGVNPAAVSRARASGSKSVSIVDFAFKPKKITVHTGDNVVWTNNGEQDHTVQGDGLKSTVLKTNNSYAHTFNRTGTFSYVCTIHPQMKGTVEVLGRSSGSGGSGGPTSGDSGASPTAPSATTPSAAPSAGTAAESSAGSSDSGGGSSGSLPATGSDALGLAIRGLLLLDFGLALRVLGTARARRRA